MPDSQAVQQPQARTLPNPRQQPRLQRRLGPRRLQQQPRGLAPLVLSQQVRARGGRLVEERLLCSRGLVAERARRRQDAPLPYRARISASGSAPSELSCSAHESMRA